MSSLCVPHFNSGVWGEDPGADGCWQRQYPQIHAWNLSATTATQRVPIQNQIVPQPQKALRLNHWLNPGANYIVSRDRPDANIIIIIIIIISIIIIIDLHI